MADDVPETREDALSEPTPSAEKQTTPGKPRRMFAIGLLVPLLLACSCGGCSLFARGWIAGVITERALASHGLACEALDVDVTLALDQATVAPTHCTIDAGAIETIELVDPLVVDVVMFAPTHVHAGQVRIGLRGEAPDVDAGALGPIAGLFHIPERIGLLVRAASEIAALAPPPVDVASLSVMRSEQASVTIEGLALDGARPLAITAREVTLPSLDGPLGSHADVRIDALRGSATRDAVTLTGTLHVDGSAPLLGELHRDGEVTVSGAALTSAEPTYAIGL